LMTSTLLTALTRHTFSASSIKLETERSPFWHSWSDAGGAEQPHRTRLPGCN
jgi:hypothetical protein